MNIDLKTFLVRLKRNVLYDDVYYIRVQYTYKYIFISGQVTAHRKNILSRKLMAWPFLLVNNSEYLFFITLSDNIFWIFYSGNKFKQIVFYSFSLFYFLFCRYHIVTISYDAFEFVIFKRWENFIQWSYNKGPFEILIRIEYKVMLHVCMCARTHTYT